MRIAPLVVVLGSFFLSACGDGSSSTSNSGGGGSAVTGGGGTGGTATTGGTGGSGGSTTSTSSTSSSTSSSSSSTTMPTDLCDTAGSTPISLAADLQPIFSQSCGGTSSCHMKATPSEGLSLKAGQSYGELVNVPAVQDCNGQVRVKPGSASESYLVNKIENVGICAGEKKMPPSSTLNAANKQKIIDWICQGAQDN